jgi:Domain of unknown function (DUF4136)
MSTPRLVNLIARRNVGWLLGPLVLLSSVGAWACDDDDDDIQDEVYTRVKPGVDFSEYETFRIDDTLNEEDLADAGVAEDIPDDVKLNIDTANDQARMELEKLGLTELDKDDESADLVVASLGSTADEDAIYWECVPGYWWGYWGWYWDDCAWLDPVHVNFVVGSVALGLADPEMQDVVFGGLLQGVANGEGDTEQRIRAGVHRMFEDYPEP